LEVTYDESLSNLAIGFNLRPYKLDRRERAMDEREARLIGVEAIEARPHP
jgi:hypothetical protein